MGCEVCDKNVTLRPAYSNKKKKIMIIKRIRNGSYKGKFFLLMCLHLNVIDIQSNLLLNEAVGKIINV